MIVVLLSLVFCMYVSSELIRRKLAAQQRRHDDYQAHVRLLREVRRYDKRL